MASSLYYNQLSENVLKSRHHLLDMLEDRGFETKDYRQFNQNMINVMLNSSNKVKDSPETGPLDILLQQKDSKNKEKCFVKYKLDKFKQSKSLNTFINTIFENIIGENDTLIIITISKVLFKNPKENILEKYINDFFVNKGYFIQFFGIENLLFNVSKHITVPKHKKLNQEEINTMLQNYNTESIQKLPTVRREDPMAKYVGMRPNDVCKITKKSVSSGIYTSYRRCTPN